MTRRQSTRVRKTANYAGDVYKELDSEAEDPMPILDHDTSADEDFMIPDAPTEEGEPAAPSEDESELSEPPLSEEGEESGAGSDMDSDDDGRRRTKSKSAPNTSKASEGRIGSGGAAERDREPGEAARVHKKHFRTVDSGKGKGKRKERLIAEGGNPADARIPDPSVRITYRPGFSKATGKRDRLQHIFGADNEVLVKAVWVRDQSIGNPAIPTKDSLGYTPFWDRENEEGPTIGEGSQKVRNVEYDEPADEVPQYLPPTANNEIKCILGAAGQQKVINFKRFGINNLGDIDARKNAFLLNAGGMVIGMDWAPNRPESCQYLAISTFYESERLGGGLRDGERPTAYDKRPSKACIQLWCFPVNEKDEICKPSLSVVLCHDWGPARGLKWCPVAYTPKTPRELGYLAGVFADGKVRVLKVNLPDGKDEGSQYCSFVKYLSPAFECGLADDVCTTLSWGSASQLVAGCTSGSIATWDLSTAPTSSAEPFDPYLYLPIHQTYITQLSTCYPSFPHTIVSSSMDGYCRITSLLDPFADTVPNNRSRIASMTIAWVDGIQSAVSCEESTWVKFFPLRRFFSSTTVCKHQGVVRCIGSSFAHTMLLTGGTEGEVLFSNPTRRVFHGKIKNYQQTWFLLEYAESTKMYRMTEGFKLEECEHKTKNNNKNSQIYSAVYPVEVGITIACWNPNLKFAGWATAAASCGLVRVENVAY